MKVYVAGAWREHLRVREAQAALRAAGITITFDWTALVDQFPTDNAPPAEARANAWNDIDGVRHADAVLVLTPDDRAMSSGIWVEMGVALTNGIPVVITGAQRERNVFCSLAVAKFEADAEGVACLVAHGDDLFALRSAEDAEHQRDSEGWKLGDAS